MLLNLYIKKCHQRATLTAFVVEGCDLKGQSILRLKKNVKSQHRNKDKNIVKLDVRVDVAICRMPNQIRSVSASPVASHCIYIRTNTYE